MVNLFQYPTVCRVLNRVDCFKTFVPEGHFLISWTYYLIQPLKGEQRFFFLLQKKLFHFPTLQFILPIPSGLFVALKMTGRRRLDFVSWFFDRFFLLIFFLISGSIGCTRTTQKYLLEMGEPPKQYGPF